MTDFQDEAQAEYFKAWCDATLDASSWWDLGRITPSEAAALLCELNPNDIDFSSPETGREDFKRLLRVFNDIGLMKSHAH